MRFLFNPDTYRRPLGILAILALIAWPLQAQATGGPVQGWQIAPQTSTTVVQQIIYMLGQATATCISGVAVGGDPTSNATCAAAPNSIGPSQTQASLANSLLLNSANNGIHPYVIMTQQDPTTKSPYPTSITALCGALCAAWHPVIVLRLSHYDWNACYSKFPQGYGNNVFASSAKFVFPTPIPATAGYPANNAGIAPLVSLGLIPGYVKYIMYDNELETSQGTPICETNNPPSYYTLAAAAVHSLPNCSIALGCDGGPVKFFATGGLHPTYPCSNYNTGAQYSTSYATGTPSGTCGGLGGGTTLVPTPGWSPYPCRTSYPCSTQWTNDFYATATVWEGYNIQEQIQVGSLPTPPPGSPNTYPVPQAGNGYMNIMNAAFTNIDPIKVGIQYSSGTGNYGNCYGIVPGCGANQSGLLPQVYQDAGAADGSTNHCITYGGATTCIQQIIWFNIGAHQGGVDHTCYCPNGTIYSRYDMAAQTIIDLQFYTPRTY